MAGNRQNDRETRVARERLRAYQARQHVHAHTTKRRKRDNIIATIGVVVIVVLAVLVQLVYFGVGPGKVIASTKTPTPTPAPTATTAPAAGENSGQVPPATLADNRTWSGTLTVNKIPLAITLDGAKAPQAVSSTIKLIQSKFYIGTVCWRLTNATDFKVLQCGDPLGKDPAKAGTGGPGYSYGPIENAPADNVYPAGTIAMARTSDNAYSMGSQFFIVWGKTSIPSDSAGGYTVIGHVTSGLDELKSQVTSKGLTPSGTDPNDGRPKVTATITAATIK